MSRQFRSSVKSTMAVGAALALLAGGVAVGSAGAAASSEPGDATTAEFDPDGHLVFADPFQNDTIDPAKNDSGFPTRQLAPVYDRLIGLSPDGELEPQLATEWEFTEELTLQLTLREGVTFQDGAEFNAEAVVANLERSRAMEEASAAVATPASAIDEVVAVDDLTVEITLNRPLYSIVYDLAQNLGMMISPDALDGNLDTEAVGAGMYRLVDFQPGVSASYERWDGYWDPEAAALASMEIRSIGNAQTRLNAVESGQVTMSMIDENQVTAAEDAGLNVTTQANVSAWTLFLNLTRGELGDVRVRQAISTAIDRQALVEVLADGHGEPTIQLFPQGYYAYSEDVDASQFDYDPEAAKALLEEAGVENLTISLLVLNRPLDEQLAQAMQQMLGDAGITVDLQVVEPARYSLFTDGEVDSFLGRWGGRANPADSLYSNAGAEGFINPGGGTTDEFEAIMTELAATSDDEERAELIRAASAEFANQQLDIPIFTRESLFADNGCVAGFEPYLFGADEYRGVGILADCG